MSEKDLIRNFPNKKISPEDGMAITADVWNSAHEYHRQRQQLYDLLSQGPGIVAGLEIEATDTPSNTVCISPGIAMDPLGQIVVLNDTDIRRFNFEERDGPLHLVLSYHSGRPRHDKNNTGEDDPKYIHDEYIIEAKKPGGYDPTQVIELARIRRSNGNAPIVNAQDFEHPASNEIDLRFRKQVGKQILPTVTLGVSFMGTQVLERHKAGVNHLARALRNLGLYRVCVDMGISLATGLEDYTLVYLVGHQSFKPTQEEIQIIYNYHKNGGVIFIESCRHDVNEGPAPAEASFNEILASLGVQLKSAAPSHDLFGDPFLFAGAPAGFEDADKGQLRVSEGIIVSTYDYGCLWQGEHRSRIAQREEIRAAMEWGANLINYALKHNRKNKPNNTQI
ncbi:MAG: DUF4159 domain-containing protein [Anaerolineae bacterium]|nr:DUF4159 domain-containing protein [Anaerolineae bacterium]